MNLESSITDVPPLPSSVGAARVLAKGQLWRVRGGYIEIRDLGSRQAQYRILWQKGQQGALTRMMRISALQGYLKENEAILENHPSEAA